MRNASKDEVNYFLKRFRKYMHKAHNFTFVPRKFDFTMLGLTLEQAKKIVGNLKYTDYYKGPSPDHNGDGTDVWVFGKMIDGEMAYIKLKISNEGLCKCLSFKPAEKPMRLPYKK